MTKPFRFAVQGRDFDDRETVVAVARQAEALGYDEMFSYDHIGSVDPFLPLMVAAEATITLRVGPLVLNNEFHHPALIARTAATVDRLTGGRLVLGLGTGYAQSEHDAIGMLLREPRSRVTRFEESVVVIRSLLDTGAAEFEGEHHRLALDDLGVRPIQGHVPMLIGGHGKRVAGIAGRHADIFQFTGLTQGDDGRPAPGGLAIEAVRERSRMLADAAGDRLVDIESSALVQVTHVGEGAADQLQSTSRRWSMSVELLNDTPFVLIGSVEQVVDKIERLRDDVGISHYVVRDPEGFAPVVAALKGR
ncbi:MAG: TIGR03621 family F420-dependent LLM class oxidoreductase [Ilumatobacteraceae bacterium]